MLLWKQRYEVEKRSRERLEAVAVETAEAARAQIKELASRLLGFEGNIQEIKNYRITKDLDESKKLVSYDDGDGDDGEC